MMNTKTNKYIVKGMTCAACVKSVEDSALKVNGVEEVNVSLLTNSLEIKYNENFDETKIKKQLKVLAINYRQPILRKRKIIK